MAKEILIYVKDPETKSFLRDFFGENSIYSTEFASRDDDVKDRLENGTPDVLIVESPECLASISDVKRGVRIVALIARDVMAGIKAVVKDGIETYLISPFHAEDLSYRLALLFKKDDYLKTLYQEKKDIESVSDLTYLLSSTLDPDELLYLIVKKLSDLIPVTRCSILSVDGPDDKTLDVVSTFEDPAIKNLKLELSNYPEIIEAVSKKKPVVIQDATRDPLMKSVRSKMAALGIRTIVVVPILFRSEVIGTLFLRTSTSTFEFTDREVRLCKQVALAAANALDNAHLFQKVQARKAELERLSITDFLTGIYNVRYLYHRLEKEFSRARRYGTNLSSLMFDIDRFKKINDSYGHRTGDMVIRDFARLIDGHSRTTDVFARYGGEEFIILMPDTALEGAVSEANRLIRLVREHKFRGLKEDNAITMSIGVASYPHPDIQSQDDLIRTADDALLKAKEQGRDRIVVYE